jgi:hypothetical protein
MDMSLELLLGMTGLGITALTAFAVYRWHRRARALRVRGWVEEFLAARYGGRPDRLSVDCSDDALWPVLVAFEGPGTGTRHRLQFSCGGRPRALTLLSEVEDKR